jgi:hypothetical protein
MASPDGSVGRARPTAKIGRPWAPRGATGPGALTRGTKKPRLGRGFSSQRRADPSCLSAGSDNYNARFRPSRHWVL